MLSVTLTRYPVSTLTPAPAVPALERSPRDYMSISPWDSFAELASPDGRYVATYDNAMEIAMGAPTRGTLTVRQKGQQKPLVVLPDASGSFVWSSDSTALAYPRWTKKRDQNLCILRLPRGQNEVIEGRFDVLQLESFCEGRLIGVDSPIYRTKKIDIQVPKTARE